MATKRRESTLAAQHRLSNGLMPRYDDRSYRFLKRIVDIVVAGVALLLLLPIFLVVAIIIVADDGFPFVFRQQRVGLGGELFWIYKFRSMRKDAEEILKSNPALMEEYKRNFKLENDPRLLRCGKFLRSSTLDELPQLVNVLMGTMSLVGPRPIVLKELEKYSEAAELYTSMKPGCAGLWQSQGRSDLSYDERVMLDVRYYTNASIRFDFMIMFDTFASIIRRKGAR